MNLHAIAAAGVRQVNPMLTAMLSGSTGTYATAADGTRTPQYRPPIAVRCQVQPLASGELAFLDGLDLQGVKKKAYLPGQWSGVIRASQHGGDLLALPDGTHWLIVTVLEQWPDWCCVALTQQIA